jgi:spore germination cell wall hydrolase CwlJ-like protein
LSRALLGGCAVALAIGAVYLASDGVHPSVATAKPTPPAKPVVVAAAPAAVQQLAVQAVAPTALKAGLRPAIATTPARPFQLAGGVQSSSRDVDCLTAAVYYEARGESAAGQAAVAQVVLNRVRHPAFPNTVCGVVYQGVHSAGGCQFSFACDGDIGRPREIGAWRRAQGVAMHALAGGVMAAVGDATHFHSISAGYGVGRGMTRVARIGLQVFYKFSGYEGAASRFSTAPQRSSADDASPARAEGRASGRYLLASAPAEPAAAPVPAAAPAPAAAPPAVAKAAAPSL